MIDSPDILFPKQLNDTLRGAGRGGAIRKISLLSYIHTKENIDGREGERYARILFDTKVK